MDDLTQAIADFAVGFNPDDMSEAAVQAMTDHIIDAYGCALAGFDEQPARIARSLASAAGPGASVIGLARPATPEQAAFANAVMVRCLDFNDTFNSRTGGHPSDMLAGIVAMAEMAGLPFPWRSPAAFRSASRGPAISPRGKAAPRRTL